MSCACKKVLIKFIETLVMMLNQVGHLLEKERCSGSGDMKYTNRAIASATTGLVVVNKGIDKTPRIMYIKF